MTEGLGIIAIMFIGLAGGLAVGSGLVAFLVVLDVIPRLSQITRTYSRIHAYETSVVIGAIFWTFSDFFEWKLALFPLGASLFGILAGIFVGMLAAALTEVLNVFPILAKRLKMESYLIWLLMAVVFGKVLGSIVDWVIISH